MVTPSCAVTETVIVLVPISRLIAELAAPEATVVPLTLRVASTWAVVAVTVTMPTSLATVAAYVRVLEANTGLRVPALRARPERLGGGMVKT